jgi:hypothetical protein
VSSSEALHRDDGNDDTFPLFSVMGNAKYLFPSRLCHREDGEPVCLTSPPYINQTSVVEKQRKALAMAYETLGKVMNQMLREGMLLPDCFSSPLLLRYLLYGMDGLRMSGSLHRNTTLKDQPSYTNSCLEGTVEELYQYEVDDLYSCMLDVDYDTFWCPPLNSEGIDHRGPGYGSPPTSVFADLSGVQHNHVSEVVLQLRKANNYTVESVFDHILYPHVLKPRMEALQLIRKGFESVPVVPNFFRAKAPVSVIREYFVAKEFVSPEKLMQTVKFVGTEQDIVEALLRSSAGNGESVKSPVASGGDVLVPVGLRKRQPVCPCPLPVADVNTVDVKRLYQEALVMVQESLMLLDSQQCTNLLKFWTGSASYMPSIDLLISISPFFSHENVVASYPEFPLAKSLTCACHLFVPVIFDIRKLCPCQAVETTAAVPSRRPSFSSVESVRNNLLNSCMNLAGDYSDKAVISSR